MTQLTEIRKEMKAAKFRATYHGSKYRHYMQILPALIISTERFNYTEAEKEARIGVLKYKAERLEIKFERAKNEVDAHEAEEEAALERIERLKQLIRSKQ